MARLRVVAIALGAVPVRTREASSAKVTHVVQGFHLPVTADQPGEPVRGGLFGSEAGDRVDRLDGGLAVDGRAHQCGPVVLDWVGRVPGEPGTHGVIEGVAVNAGQRGGPAEDREQAQGEQGVQPVVAALGPPWVKEPVQYLPQRSQFRQLCGRTGQVGVPAVTLRDTDQGG